MGSLLLLLLFFIRVPRARGQIRAAQSLPKPQLRQVTRCSGLGIEPESQRSQDAAHPVSPQRELLLFGFFLVFTFSLVVCEKHGWILFFTL